MNLRMFSLLLVLVCGFALAGCDAGAKPASNEPVVQDLEIETGEAFVPGEKKDK